MKIRFVDSGARFDKERRYRYALWRTWGLHTKKHVNFVMLNPSTADETVLDPTVTRCMNFAYDWGYDGAYVTNIFAIRSTDPKLLYSTPDPVGPANDRFIGETANFCDLVVVAWGAHGKLKDRGFSVAGLLDRFYPQCFGLTKAGHPKHPLYLSKKSDLIPYRLIVARELAGSTT